MNSGRVGRIALSVSAEIPSWKISSEWQPLVQLTQAQHQAIVQDFCQWVDELSQLNGPQKRAWWYTWLASRDQLNCAILNWWRELYCLERLLQQEAHGPCLEVRLSHALLIPTATAIAHRNGYQTRQTFANGCAYYWARLRNLSIYIYQWSKFVYYALISYYFCCRISENQNNTVPLDVLLVSIFHGKEFDSLEYRDTYFGGFSSHLKSKELAAATVGFCYNQPRRVLGSILHSKSPNIHPFGSQVGFLEISRISAVILIFPFCLKLHHPKYPVFCYWDNIADAWMYGLAMLGEATVKKLCDQQEGRLKIVQIFENNPWERCVAFAALQSKAMVDRFGFHHCAVIPFHLKNRLSPGEFDAGLIPDQLISTGVRATQALQNLSQVDIAINTGCHLRATTPIRSFEESLEAHHKSPLVVLEGLWKAIGLIAVILLYLRRFPQEIIYVRAHPVLPLDVILEAMKERRDNYPNLKERRCALETDLSRASVVIYQGSTVAITAAIRKIPLLHFSGNWYPTDNPLFLASSSVKNFAGIEDLHVFLALCRKQQLYSISDIASIADYAEDYLRVPSKDNLDEMCNLIFRNTDVVE
jgi:hypothetical protein